MAFVSRLRVANVRNIKAADLQGLSQFNLFVGKNGAGKTSLLESISLLGLGRSFRSNRVASVVTEGVDHLLVVADIQSDLQDPDRLGIRRQVSGGLDIRVNGESEKKLSALAKRLPLVLISSEVFDLVEGGPSNRREYLDWILFYVEQTKFHSIWSAYYRTLKQRNELLKRGNIDKLSLKVWDNQLAELGEGLNSLREYALKRVIDFISTDCLDTFGGDIAYRMAKGWPDDKSLLDALEASHDRDLKYRTTNCGPHRMDIAISVGTNLAKDVLSRGQIKTLASSMKLGMAKFVAASHSVAPVLLIDDVSAEMDAGNRKAIIEACEESGLQCFLTAIQDSNAVKWADELNNLEVFHVEHGVISKSRIND